MKKLRGRHARHYIYFTEQSSPSGHLKPQPNDRNFTQETSAREILPVRRWKKPLTQLSHQKLYLEHQNTCGAETIE